MRGFICGGGFISCPLKTTSQPQLGPVNDAEILHRQTDRQAGKAGRQTCTIYENKRSYLNQPGVALGCRRVHRQAVGVQNHSWRRKHGT